VSTITARDEALGIGSYDRDDDLIAPGAAAGEPRLRVYRPARPEVVLGRGSRPDLELRLEACRADGVPLLRRRGGGCAVVLDPGNVVVALALPARGLGDNPGHFRRVSDWLIAALEDLGAAGVAQDGISDLTQGEHKVAGACIYRARDLLFYSATLLVDPRVALMERYLRHPPREPAYRRGRSHAQFVARLTDVRGAALDVDDVTGTLEARLSAGLDDLARATAAGLDDPARATAAGGDDPVRATAAGLDDPARATAAGLDDPTRAEEA
jgi:lipoate-protein ligase A